MYSGYICIFMREDVSTYDIHMHDNKLLRHLIHIIYINVISRSLFNAVWSPGPAATCGIQAAAAATSILPDAIVIKCLILHMNDCDRNNM